MPRKCQGCKGFHKDIQDGYTDNKDTDGWKSYRYQLQIRSAKPLQEKSSSLIFFAASPWINGIRGRSHMDITDVTGGRTDRKDDP